MAVQRVWFPHAPDGTIDAADRARQGIGYGGIAIAAPAIITAMFNTILAKKSVSTFLAKISQATIIKVE